MTRKVLLAGTCCAAMIAVAVWACGPSFPVAVFSFKKHPDVPRTEFLKGSLGVLKPTYARSYLVVAYRYLIGAPLSAEEQEQIRLYFMDRGTGGWEKWEEVDWEARWKQAVDKVLGPEAELPSPVTGGTLKYDLANHAAFVNCAEDAFRTAIRTLEARHASFGAESPALKSWAEAQRRVFSQCDGMHPRMPEAAGPKLPELIRKDRDYQMAAAHFYALHTEEAVRRFRAISEDQGSPWRTISRYLVVRVLRRSSNAEDVRTAGEEARRILEDKTLAPIHAAVAAQEARIGVQEKSPETLLALARGLSRSGQEFGWRDGLWYAMDLYDSLIDPWDPWDNSKKKPLDSELARKTPLTDWIFTFQHGDVNRATKQWRETHGTEWLVAALASATPAEARGDGLMDAAAAVRPDSPAFATVAFHRARLMIQQGQMEAARAWLDPLLAQDMHWPPSARNDYQALRGMAAASLPDFAAMSLLRPVQISNTADPAETWPPFDPKDGYGSTKLLDGPATAAWNERIPMKLLRAAAEKKLVVPALPLAVFTRAVLLEDRETRDAMLPVLESGNPRLKPWLAMMRVSKTEEDRRFASVLLILNTPGARPFLDSGVGRTEADGRLDDYRDNWWCTIAQYDAIPFYMTWQDQKEMKKPVAPELGFLSAEERQQAAGEWKRLQEFPLASAFLMQVVLDYAKAHPDDARLPEAFYRAFRSHRYSCAGEAQHKPPQLKEAAFYMERKYPGNPWLKKSRAFFGGW